MLKLLAEFDKNSKKECEAVKVRTVSSQLGQMDGFQWDRLTRSGSVHFLKLHRPIWAPELWWLGLMW